MRKKVITRCLSGAPIVLLCSTATFPIAYATRWMNHDAERIFLYFEIFFVIYFIIWILQYFSIKVRIEQMNDRIREGNSDI